MLLPLDTHQRIDSIAFSPLAKIVDTRSAAHPPARVAQAVFVHGDQRHNRRRVQDSNLLPSPLVRRRSSRVCMLLPLGAGR